MSTESRLTDEEIRKAVERRYSEIARSAGRTSGSGCCSSEASQYAARLGYTSQEIAAAPPDANLGQGCGAPLAHVALKPGETVVDLGSGAGFDAFIAARAVGTEGKVIGVDMTDEMLARARANALSGGYKNVEFRQGRIESLPVENGSIDAVISNCVINLVPDKAAVFREVARVLRPGGRMVVSDLVLDAPLPPPVRESVGALTCCVGGTWLRTDYLVAITDAGLEDLTVLEDKGLGPVAASILPEEEARRLTGEGVDVSSALRSVRSITIRALKPASLK